MEQEHFDRAEHPPVTSRKGFRIVWTGVGSYYRLETTGGITVATYPSLSAARAALVGREPGIEHRRSVK